MLSAVSANWRSSSDEACLTISGTPWTGMVARLGLNSLSRGSLGKRKGGMGENSNCCSMETLNRTGFRVVTGLAAHRAGTGQAGDG
ncbi:hypothetical protein AAC387_Pa05g3021 [Persea americana]